MAIVPVILTFGNSNAGGYALLGDVPAADFQRWTGTTLPTTYPIDISIPGIKCWTPKLPYATYTTHTISASSPTSVTASANTGAVVGQWIYVDTATTGQGQTAQITAIPTPTTELTVPAWTAPSTTNSTFQLIANSHTLDGTPTTTALSKTAATATVAGSVGKWVVVISGAAIGQASRIASVSAPDDLVLEDALTVAPSAGDGIVILDGSGAVNGVSTYLTANASFQDMRFYYDQSYTYRTGYDYANISGFPSLSPYLATLLGKRVSYLPELAWWIRNCYTEPLYCVPLGVGASRLSPYHTSLGHTSFSWYDNAIHNDWHPGSSNDLFSVYENALTLAMSEITNAGDTPNIVGVFVNLSELEAADLSRSSALHDNMKLLRDHVRSLIQTNGWSQPQGKRVPWVMFKTSADASITYASTVNDAMDQIARDDVYSASVDVGDISFGDGTHYDGSDVPAYGRSGYEAWKSILSRASDALDEVTNLLSLATIRTSVRKRYERNGSGNDDTDSQVDQFINDSLREIYNTMGTNAWFLRRVEQLTMETAYPGTLTLPYPVRQLLRIENVNYPGRPVEHKGISYTDSGRIQITLHDYTGGPYYCHFMTMPQDLVEDADRALIPPHHVELVVMLSCKRLAEAAGNISVATYFAGESQRLWSMLKREGLRMDRFRNESLTTIPAYDSWRNGAAGSTMGYL